MTEVRSSIMLLSREGHGVREIARRLGLAQSTVHQHLRGEVADQNTIAPTGPTTRSSSARTQIQTRAQVARLLDEGMTRAEASRRLGISKSTVSYHARRLGQVIDERCARRYDWSAVQSFHDAGHGARACIREFGFSSETWHAAVKRGDLVARSPFLPIESVFAAGTPHERGHLKKRMRALGRCTDVCEQCGLREWRGEPLSIALHHVNGVRDDNRLENLQLLCPNCHSQTDNFAGRRRAPPEATDADGVS